METKEEALWPLLLDISRINLKFPLFSFFYVSLSWTCVIRTLFLMTIIIAIKTIYINI